MYIRRANRTGNKTPLLAMLFAVAVCLANSAPALALFGWGQPANKPPEPPDDDLTLALVESIAHQPELMNVRYLHYVIGHPVNEAQMVRAQIKHFFWYAGNSANVKYELVQREAAPGKITQSTFVAHMSNCDADLGAIQSKYGEAPRKFFDLQSSPNVQYSFAPDTTVSYKQPQNKFRVTDATINFVGDALPPLSALSVSQAQLAHRTTALDHHKHGHWSEAIPALRTHVLEHPQDSEAHVALAEAYKGNSNLNEAADEFRTALAQTDDSGFQKRCLEGLKQLRILPGEGEDADVRHELVLHHHGQHLRQGDQTNPKPVPAPPRTFVVQPLEPATPAAAPITDASVGF